MLHKQFTKQDGQSLVLLAILMIGMLAMLALVLVDFLLRDEAHRAGQDEASQSPRIKYGLREASGKS